MYLLSHSLLAVDVPGIEPGFPTGPSWGSIVGADQLTPDRADLSSYLRSVRMCEAGITRGRVMPASR